jgi:hypothetical protein
VVSGAGSFVCLAVLLGGCSSAALTAAQRATSTALAPYVVQANEETGYAPVGKPVFAATPALWTEGAAGAAKTSRRLTEEGFRAALTQHTGEMENAAGVSWVIEFSTPAGAQHELATSFAQSSYEQSPNTPFAIPSIPGARGFVAHGNGKSVTDVWCTEGACLLFVGDLIDTSADPKTAVVAGASAVYDRTAHSHGLCTQASASS